MVNIRADGIAVVLGPLLRDVRIVAAALVDVDSGMAKRATFIIDADGRIRYSVVNPRGQARDFGEYRAALAGLKQA